MRLASKLVLAAAFSAAASGAALAQQGPGIGYYNDNMTRLEVARSQHMPPLAPFATGSIVPSQPTPGQPGAAPAPAEPRHATRARRAR
ncbi:MAG: hypothetical protein J0H41_04750 [Rhizobiales bacterium]|nr:hypothetical protein [Hyphomicrobiales bacterium]